MKFFIDTANIDEIKAAKAMGLLDGVTTNPSLAAKEGKVADAYPKLIAQICEICPGPISAEVVSVEADGMMAEARELVKIAPNVVVKIPTIPEGLKGLAMCVSEGIKVNMTLCFQPIQALCVAKIGAAYISPFLGRLDDIGHDGMDLIRDIRQIYDNYAFDCEILAASLRHPLHVLQAAKVGADVATLPYGLFVNLLKHPLTDIGLAKFLADWNKG
jgi:transaldolase